MQSWAIQGFVSIKQNFKSDTKLDNVVANVETIILG